MTWESPIKMWTTEVELQYENEVLNAISRLHIEVNKEELVRALNYDRHQYEQGYRDGKLSVMNKEAIPIEWIKEQVADGYYDICEIMYHWERENNIKENILFGGENDF